MALEGRRISVLGAGIGGLATAVALARRGAEVEVLEQAPEIAEIGAGLQVSPNGFVVLRALGLAGALYGVSDRCAAVVLRDGPSGRQVLRLDLGQAAYHLVHRADLIAILAEAARVEGVSLRTDHRIAYVSPGLDGVDLVFEDGRSERTPFLVGADGGRSLVAKTLNQAVAAAFSGQVAWRALVEGDGGAPEATVHLGPGRHLVSYPLRGGALHNLVGVQERAGWAAEGWHRTDDPDNLRAAFAGFAAPVGVLLDRVRSVNLWGLHERPVARRWYGPGCALVGDAAHPTLPFLAQGASLALEDAYVLAECLDRREGIAALALYQGLRRDRARRAVAASRANARNYHLTWPLAPLAHVGLGLLGRLSSGLMLQRLDWLYGHDVVAEMDAY